MLSFSEDIYLEQVSEETPTCLTSSMPKHSMQKQKCPCSIMLMFLGCLKKARVPAGDPRKALSQSLMDRAVRQHTVRVLRAPTGPNGPDQPRVFPNTSHPWAQEPHFSSGLGTQTWPGWNPCRYAAVRIQSCLCLLDGLWTCVEVCSHEATSPTMP